ALAHQSCCLLESNPKGGLFNSLLDFGRAVWLNLGNRKGEAVRIFVTGGSGHLGANLVRHLLRDGHDVVALAQRGTNNRGLTEGSAGQAIRVVYGDLRDPSSFQSALQACKAAYHAAAMLVTRPGGEREIYETNVVGTRNLLAAARQAGVRRVVVTGSFSAVGH